MLVFEQFQNFFDEFGFLQIAYLLSLAIAGLSLVVCFRQRNAIKKLALKLETLQKTKTLGWKILASNADGFFFWDHVEGELTISKSLALSLNLSKGANSDFEDVLDCFSGVSPKLLEKSCSKLRSDGTKFIMELELEKHHVQAVGQRIKSANGELLADLVWIRQAVKMLGSNSKSDQDSDFIRVSIKFTFLIYILFNL